MPPGPFSFTGTRTNYKFTDLCPPMTATPIPTNTPTNTVTDTPTDTPTSWNITRMMDQHAFMDIADGDDLRVGDMVAFDISHPCLTFDKWRYLPVLDNEYRVIDIVQTFF